VHVLEALEYLVYDILLVDVFENVGTDYGVQVGVHEVEHQVDVAVVFRPDHVLEADDVLVSRQLLEEDDLSEGTLGVGGVLECIEVLLESDDFLGSFVNGLPDDTVGTLA
jgi:hypothetical protein